MTSLLNAGHHVTVVAPFKSQNSHENLTQIFSKMKGREDNPTSQIAPPGISWFPHMIFVFNMMDADCRYVMSMEEVKVRTKIEKSKFQYPE